MDADASVLRGPSSPEFASIAVKERHLLPHMPTPSRDFRPHTTSRNADRSSRVLPYALIRYNHNLASVPDIISSTAASVQTVLLAAAAIYGARQLHEARRTRHLSLLIPLFQELNSRQSVDNRRQLYTSIAPKKSKATKEDENLVNDIVNQFDFLGYVSRKSVADVDLVLGLYYGTIIRCWRDSEWYVSKQRELRSSPFAAHFEWLNQEAIRFQLKHHPSAKLERFGIGSQQVRRTRQGRKGKWQLVSSPVYWTGIGDR